MQPAAVERDFAARVEGLGFGALWFGEAPPTNEAFTHAALLLGATRRITVATGIASIWARDAAASVAAAATLGDAFSARDRTAGAHPYFVPVEHTVRARAALGPRPLLAPEHAFVLDDDADRARAVGRQYAKAYLRRTNYTNNLRDLGDTDEDFADDGRDRLIDALVAWGDVETIARKLRAHLDAGADHVCVQPLGPIETAADQLAALAPALGVSSA